MRKIYLLILSLFICVTVQADTVERYKVYVTGDTVTADNLNGNFDNLTTTINGGIDNTNVNTKTHRFVEIYSTLPAAGEQGRVIYNKSDNLLYWDDGTNWTVSLLEDGAGDLSITNNLTVGGDLTVDGDISFLPTGMIMLWSGSTASIPTGWHICDGTEGTPDLRDKFIVGAGSSYAVAATGGEATHALTIDEMPAHTHSFPVGVYDGFNTYTTRDSSSTQGSVNTASTGSGNAHNNLPPYYALAYIMRL